MKVVLCMRSPRRSPAPPAWKKRQERTSGEAHGRTIRRGPDARRSLPRASPRSRGLLAQSRSPGSRIVLLATPSHARCERSGIVAIRPRSQWRGPRRSWATWPRPPHPHRLPLRIDISIRRAREEPSRSHAVFVGPALCAKRRTPVGRISLRRPGARAHHRAGEPFASRRARRTTRQIHARAPTASRGRCALPRDGRPWTRPAWPHNVASVLGSGGSVPATPTPARPLVGSAPSAPTGPPRSARDGGLLRSSERSPQNISWLTWSRRPLLR